MIPWLLLAGSALWLAGCSATSPVATAAAAAPIDGVSVQPRQQNPWSEPARELLTHACGSCHVPGLPTSQPMALLVFNLEENPWHGRMSEDQLRELGKRASGLDTIEGRETIRSFVVCALEGRCIPSPG